MKIPEKIDLHMHTRVSDGTDSPAELISVVKAAGIELFSVTDHDAVKGCAEIAEILPKDGPAFITGAEFSCKDEKGQYHVLGYGYDPRGEPMNALVELGHSFRMSKLKKRLSYLESEFGFSFSESDTDALCALDNPGKPHIGNLMVKYGYAPSKEVAIRDYIDKFRAGSEYVRPEQAIAAIKAGGGVPVLAHPSYGKGDELIMGDGLEERLKRLIDFGLEGAEAFYSGFTPKLQAEVLRLADRYGLYVTAGSDYHGKNKLVAVGDTNLPPSGEYPRGLIRFLERTGIL